MFLTSLSNSCHRHSGSVLFNQPQALNTLNFVFMIFFATLHQQLLCQPRRPCHHLTLGRHSYIGWVESIHMDQVTTTSFADAIHLWTKHLNSGQQIFGTGPNLLAATKFHHGGRRLLLEDSFQWSHTPVNPTKLKVFSLVGKPSARSFEWLPAGPIVSWWEEVSSRRLLSRKAGRWPHTGIQDRTTPN